MVVCDAFDAFPLEILYALAAVDERSYQAMLAVPLFAKSLTPGRIVDFMIAFGYSVEITKDRIEWRLHGWSHRLDGPAVEYTNGDKEWFVDGVLHRVDGPARACKWGQRMVFAWKTASIACQFETSFRRWTGDWSSRGIREWR
jgi:hypothetical protein